MSVLRRDGTVRVRVIAPCQGSSGYYSEDVLKKAAPLFAEAFTFWNHATASEEAQRPEGDLSNLAGKIVGQPTYEAAGPLGPGVYADLQVYKPYQEVVEAIGPDIGISIRALGKSKFGEVDGVKTNVIQEITAVKSVDWVTKPGAGGRIVQLFESARTRQNAPAPNPTKENHVEVDERAYQLLKESNAQMAEKLARLEEGQMLQTASQHVREVLNKRYADVLPEVTLKRLTESLAKKPPLTNGALDFEAYGVLIHEAAKAEMEYLSQITGAGKIHGMGGGEPFATPVKESIADSQKVLEEAFASIGMHPEAAKLAAAGRN